MLHSRVTRRTLLKRTALAATALVAVPYVRGANAAGKLSIGFWDHWVPGANKASETLCKEWGEKNKVEISIDYITSQGNKNLLTIAAEAQARSGHDIFAFPTWEPQAHARNLEPVDDIMAEIIKINGKVNPTVEYLARANGKWLAVPACVEPGGQRYRFTAPRRRRRPAGVDRLLERRPPRRPRGLGVDHRGGSGVARHGGGGGLGPGPHAPRGGDRR